MEKPVAVVDAVNHQGLGLHVTNTLQYNTAKALRLTYLPPLT